MLEAIVDKLKRGENVQNRQLKTGLGYAGLMDQHHPGRHWQRLEDGRLRCDICPRQCKLREGQRGLFIWAWSNPI